MNEQMANRIKAAYSEPCAPEALIRSMLRRIGQTRPNGPAIQTRAGAKSVGIGEAEAENAVGK